MVDEDPWLASLDCESLIRQDRIADALEAIEKALAASDAPSDWVVSVRAFVDAIRGAEEIVGRALASEEAGAHGEAAPLWQAAKNHAAEAGFSTVPLPIERYGLVAGGFQTLDPWARIASAYRASIIRRRVAAYDEPE